jgi:hypothetical protein
MNCLGIGYSAEYEENMFISLIEVGGFEGALFGMRNPLNSWGLSDSDYVIGEHNKRYGRVFEIGERDLDLCKRLIKGGSEHRKFLRMIHVQFNFYAPRYIWSEFDTYKIGTVANSCSTMHKLLNKDDEVREYSHIFDSILSTQGDLTLDNFYYCEDDEEVLQTIIDHLNMIRKEYLVASPKDKKVLLRRAKQLLPESYLQMRTVSTNYEVLINIYQQRKHHKLDKEWGLFCRFVEGLPYMKEFLDISDSE